MDLLIPLLVPVIERLLSPDTAQAVTDIAKESPIVTTLIMVSLPGMVLEAGLRLFPTAKRRSILLGIAQAVKIIRLILENVEAALEYVEKKIPQKVK